MKILCLQHVPFETPAALGGWFTSKGHSVQILPVYKNLPMPAVSEFDFLLIMGGPMSVNDEGVHPWLISEKKLIENSLKSGKKILGICLGAQLIASLCGARVYLNRAAAGEACANQAFIIGTDVVGLQFHLESNGESISALIENCGDDLTPGRYVQSADNIICKIDIYLEEISRNLDSLMNRFCSLLQNC